MNSAFSRLVIFVFCVTLAGCRVQTNPPELVGLSPRQAYVGQQATLTGYQFGSEPTVTFGVSSSAVAATVLNKTENTIQVTVPVVPPGTTQVRVRNDEGISDPLPFDVLQPAPSLAAVSPANGLPGTSVVITGNYLNQLIGVKFNDVDAVVKDSSTTQLTILVPSTVPRGPVFLYVQTKGGSLTYPFIVAGTPQITSISPRSIRAGGELVIQGTNLTDGVVWINDLAIFRDKTKVTDTEIRAELPTNAKSGIVSVIVFDKLVATSRDTLQIIQQPIIATISARDGVAGEKLLINGLSLRDITKVTFNGVSATYRIISDTQIEATVPALPSPANVTITLSSVGGTATSQETFFYFVAPSNLTLTPSRQLPGQPITITGQNLHRITEVRVSGQVVPITSRVEGTELRVGVPVNATSGPVTVTNRAGTATTARPLVVIQKPVVTDIIPKSARPGERVVLQGNYLMNAQIVFSGTTTPAAEGGKNEETERWVIVPADAQSGPIKVTNATNESVTTESFTVLRLVSNIDFSPRTAKVGDELVITGTNLASVQEVRFNNGTLAPAKFVLADNTLRVTVPAGATTGQICLINTAGTVCTSSNFTLAK